MSNRQMPTVTARFDRNPLNVKRAAVCHLVVEVTAPKAEQTSPQTQRPLNLGLVIDASGSMQSGDAELGFSEEFGRTRLDAAKTAGTGVVEQLEDTDTLCSARPTTGHKRPGCSASSPRRPGWYRRPALVACRILA